MNILILYNETQTFTNTVYEHLVAFSRYSEHKIFYCHCDQNTILNLDLYNFDAISVHYSIRLPFDQISDETAKKLEQYSGLKFLFIQDEYDNTKRTWYWIKRLGFQLVFTVVPNENIEYVYPEKEFPNVRFVSNLTGYVPDKILTIADTVAPSKRDLVVGYRGRPLSIKYGSLGIDKIEIGRIVKKYCNDNCISENISWTEECRIYGVDWEKFMGSCRSMLGTESGSNVFDWDGTLEQRILEYKKNNKNADDEDIYNEVIHNNEIDGLMNQVSPRVFEAIAARTVLVLFEGQYSGVIKSEAHYISVKKDGSNLKEVFELLNDGKYVDEMTDRAFNDVIQSKKYSYCTFVAMVDSEINKSIIDVCGIEGVKGSVSLMQDSNALPITTEPVRAVYYNKPLIINQVYDVMVNRVWARLPRNIKLVIRPVLKFLMPVR